jgi:hypothetical protein
MAGGVGCGLKQFLGSEFSHETVSIIDGKPTMKL